MDTEKKIIQFRKAFKSDKKNVEEYIRNFLITYKNNKTIHKLLTDKYASCLYVYAIINEDYDLIYKLQNSNIELGYSVNNYKNNEYLESIIENHIGAEKSTIIEQLFIVFMCAVLCHNNVFRPEPKKAILSVPLLYTPPNTNREQFYENQLFYIYDTFNVDLECFNREHLFEEDVNQVDEVVEQILEQIHTRLKCKKENKYTGTSQTLKQFLDRDTSSLIQEYIGSSNKKTKKKKAKRKKTGKRKTAKTIKKK